jgi:phytoene desaturase
VNKSKAIVIGAGLGGLAVALRLAARDWDVTVYEQGATVGGKMNHWACDGFKFDTGPSLLTMPWVFTELFASTGADINDYIQLQAVDPLASYVFDDGVRFRLSAALPEWLKTIRKLEARDEQGFLNFMRLGARIYTLSAHTFFRRALSEPPDRLAISALRHMPLRHAWGRYDRTIRHFFKSPQLRRIYARFPTYIGSSPYRVPATLTVIPYIEHAFGGWYVKGGMYRLVESLTHLTKKKGVNLNTGQGVRRIISQNRKVKGVELTEGSFHSCDVVIMNGDASMTGVMLGETGATPLPESQRSLSGFVMLLGIKRRLTDLAHHTVYFSSDYKAEFYDLFQKRSFPEDPTVYVSMPSKNDRTVSPSNGETLFIMANAPANDNDIWGEREIATARRRIFERLRKGGFPDIEKDIALSSVWTPRRMADVYNMPGGAIYGTHSHGWRRAFMRPPNKDKRHSGLYYVGGSTHPGGGTPTVLMSARITSELIRKNEGI